MDRRRELKRLLDWHAKWGLTATPVRIGPGGRLAPEPVPEDGDESGSENAEDDRPVRLMIWGPKDSQKGR